MFGCKSEDKLYAIEATVEVATIIVRTQEDLNSLASAANFQFAAQTLNCIKQDETFQDVTFCEPDISFADVSNTSTLKDEGSPCVVDIFSGTVKWNLEFLCNICEDRDHLLEFLRTRGLMAKCYICGVCGLPMKCLTAKQCKDEVMWRCSRDNRWLSIRKGTWFERSALSLKTILFITYFWCWKYRIDQVMHECKLTMTTVADWFSLCREMTSQFIMRRDKMGGMGKAVEISVYSFKDRCEISCDVHGMTIICGILRESKGQHLFLEVLRNKEVDTLLRSIAKNILPGSIVYSGIWKCYGGLKSKPFVDFSASYPIEFKENYSATYRCRLDSTWSAVLRFLGRRLYGKEDMDSFLKEFVWRRTVPHDQCVFRYFISCLASVYPPPESDS